MPLIRCPECNASISEDSELCLKCGLPAGKRQEVADAKARERDAALKRLFMLAVILFVGVFLLFSWLLMPRTIKVMPPPESTPVPTATSEGISGPTPTIPTPPAPSTTSTPTPRPTPTPTAKERAEARESERKSLQRQLKRLAENHFRHLNFIEVKIRKIKGGYRLNAQHDFFSKYTLSSGSFAKELQEWIYDRRYRLKEAEILEIGIEGTGRFSTGSYFEVKKFFEG